MKVSHVLFKTNNLKKTFKEFEKSGFKVEYGSKTKPHNALIYFSEGPYIEILEKAPVSSFIKLILRFIGKGYLAERFTSWENAEEGFFEICLENNISNFRAEKKLQQAVFISTTTDIWTNKQMFDFIAVSANTISQEAAISSIIIGGFEKYWDQLHNTLTSSSEFKVEQLFPDPPSLPCQPLLAAVGQGTITGRS
mgnify:CR=1 FL=1